MKNLAVRTAVAAIFGPLIIWIGYQGGYWLIALVAVLATLGLLEFLWAESFRPSDLMFWLTLLSVELLIGAVFFGDRFVEVDHPAVWYSAVAGMAVTGFFLISGMLLATGHGGVRELFWKHVRLLWGVCYIGLLYPFVYLIGMLRPIPAGLSFTGGDCLLFLFGLLWLGDTAAMGVGKWLGRHKLAPEVSPNKSVEGFFAGLVGALLIGVLMSFWLFKELGWTHVLVLAVGCSLFGQLGDLVESMWKRSLAIKDSSMIIPGHGGVLDRFDSLLFAAPFMYWYLNLLFLR